MYVYIKVMYMYTSMIVLCVPLVESVLAVQSMIGKTQCWGGHRESIASQGNTATSELRLQSWHPRFQYISVVEQ